MSTLKKKQFWAVCGRVGSKANCLKKSVSRPYPNKVTILKFGNLSVFVVCWICLVWTPIGHTYAYNSPKVYLKTFKIKCLPLTPIEWQDVDCWRHLKAKIWIVDAIWKPRFGSVAVIWKTGSGSVAAFRVPNITSFQHIFVNLKVKGAPN